MWVEIWVLGGHAGLVGGRKTVTVEKAGIFIVVFTNFSSAKGTQIENSRPREGQPVRGDTVWQIEGANGTRWAPEYEFRWEWVMEGEYIT